MRDALHVHVVDERRLRAIIQAAIALTLACGNGTSQSAPAADAGSDAQDGLPCAGTLPYTCGISIVPLDASIPGYDGGTLTGDGCKPLCGFTMESCRMTTCRTGAPVAWCAMSCTGRRPAVFVDPARHGESLGAYFAELAYLEAASVTAFAELRRDLAAHGAPRAILDGCVRAERDEVRHARLMARLARRFGASVQHPEPVRRRGRSLEAIATHNAREGCVRETFGAVVASWQARTAGDAQVRRAMRAIARDERRHAALAWAIAEWSGRRLGERARARVRAALRAEARALRVTTGAASPRGARIAVGVPTAQAAARLASVLDDVLWTSAPGGRRAPRALRA